MCSKRLVKHPSPHLQPHLYSPICPHMPRFNVTAICTLYKDMQENTHAKLHIHTHRLVLIWHAYICTEAQCKCVSHTVHGSILTRFNVTGIWAKGRQSYSPLSSDNLLLKIFQNNIRQWEYEFFLAGIFKKKCKDIPT